MFKTGAKVRIRKDLDECDMVGPVGLNANMCARRGEIHVIEDVVNSNAQVCYRLRGISFSWSAEMFDEVEDEKYEKGDMVFSHIFGDVFGDQLVLCEVVSVSDNGFNIKPIGYDDLPPRIIGAAERPKEVKIMLLSNTPFGREGEVIKAYRWNFYSSKLITKPNKPFVGIIYPGEYKIIEED